MIKRKPKWKKAVYLRYKRRAKPPPRRPISNVSKRQAKLLREYRSLRRAFLKSHPICQVCGVRKSDDVHHMYRRNGQWLLLVSLWKAICRECHIWVTDHHQTAIERGFSIERNKKHQELIL